MRWVIALVVCAGCGSTALNRASLVTSTALLACDWAQTRASANAGWWYVNETNPIMGSAPSPRTVDLYFASAAAINAAVWLLTPDKYKGAPSAAVAGIQAKAIAVNAWYGAGACGIGGPPTRPEAIRESRQP